MTGQSLPDEDVNTPSVPSHIGGMFFDPDDTAALVDWASHVTVARVDGRLGVSMRRGLPEVQYAASVLESLRGGLSGQITLNVMPFSDHVIEGAEDLEPLSVGAIYVLSTRPRPGTQWHTVALPQAARLAESPQDLALLKAEFLAALR